MVCRTRSSGPHIDVGHGYRLSVRTNRLAVGAERCAQAQKERNNKAFRILKALVDYVSQAMYCSDHLNSPFEISEIQKTLVLHTLSVDRRQVLWFVRPLKRVDNFQE